MSLRRLFKNPMAQYGILRIEKAQRLQGGVLKLEDDPELEDLGDFETAILNGPSNFVVRRQKELLAVALGLPARQAFRLLMAIERKAPGQVQKLCRISPTLTNWIMHMERTEAIIKLFDPERLRSLEETAQRIRALDMPPEEQARHE